MTTHSFKSLTAAGTFKRVDGLRVQLASLQVDPGFNLREDGYELQTHIENIKRAILAGEPIAPIEVRVSDDGRVVIVDGHCRNEAYIRAAAEGAPIEWLDVVRFTGNDIDRVARIITSQEGRKLTPLELAKGYKRLAAFGMDAEAIAKRFGKTRQHVDQMLLLANANSDVHQLVAGGKVSAAIAVTAVRANGEKAGEVLAGELDKATTAGKKKVTAATITGPKVPAKVLNSLADEVDAFMGVLPKSARERLASIENAVAAGQLPDGQTVSVPASALLSLMGEFDKLCQARVKAELQVRAKAGKAAQQELQ